MLPDSLRDYLTTCKGQGLPFDSLEPGLTQGGYSPEVISAARVWYTNPAPAPSILPHRSPVLIVSLIAGLILFLFSSLSVSAYLIAIDKIPLSNTKAKQQITKAVFSLPFIPKTPKIVLNLASQAHSRVSKNSFDFSLAASSGDFQALLGTSSLDLSVTGYSDFSNALEPKFTLTASVGPDVEIAMRKKDPLLYFKINHIPLFVYAFLGLAPDDINPVLANWIAYDTTPLATEARASLEKLQAESPPPPKSTTDEAVEATLAQLIDEEVLPALDLSTDSVDNFPSFRIHFTATPQIIDKFAQKLASVISPGTPVDTLYTGSPQASQVIKNLVLTVWVDKKDYFVRKTEISLSFESPASTPSSIDFGDNPIAAPPQKVQLVGVLKLADFGKDIPIDTPASSLTPEQFLQEIFNSSEDFSGLFGINPL